MAYTDTVPRDDILVACWREATVRMLSMNDNDTVEMQKKRRSGDEEGENGTGVAAILWHKASESGILSSMREAASELVMWIEHFVIGNPHQELVPWCGWLRPVQHRHLEWLVTWPGEEFLHP